MEAATVQLIRQHLIDPEICIRCNTCEATCPVGAITHDDNNYVVDPGKCNLCMDCISPCPTGSIDNWRQMPRSKAYTVAEQLGWEELPEALTAAALGDAAPAEGAAQAQAQAQALRSSSSFAAAGEEAAMIAASAAKSLTTWAFDSAHYGATLPPWSAAHAFTKLYGPKAPEKTIEACVTGNVRVTELGSDYDTHHIVLDFGQQPFPVLEGQSIGIVPLGRDDKGRVHHARQYSVASPRDGERPGYNNVSLTIKRVLQDHSGQPVRGVASNYMCDLKVGDRVQVIGPFGATFLMPNHPRSHIVMICTGTGSAPMRAMTEWRRRLRARQLKGGESFEGGKLLLFFGARSKEELPYFGPLKSLPKDFIDINFAFSREAGKRKRYVQDLMRERSADVAGLMADPQAYFYVCGLKAMEEGVLLALRDIAQEHGLDWQQTSAALKTDARLHLETY